MVTPLFLSFVFGACVLALSAAVVLFGINLSNVTDYVFFLYKLSGALVS